MKLPGLVIAGTLSLILAGVGGWWVLTQRMDDILTIDAPLPPAKNNISGNPNSWLWLVWYGDDATVFRLKVDADAYSDLYSALRQSLAEDQIRMESIAGSHLSATLTPVFAELPPRIDQFLDNLFAISSSASLLKDALNTATEVIRSAGNSSQQNQQQILLQAGDQARSHLADTLVKRFRDEVLLPGFTLRSLRGASGHAFLMTRQDLLEDCDRYDRAFRSFILKAPGTVESRDSDLGWRPDPSWQQGNATFLSLCPNLRHSNSEQLSDAPITEAFAAAEDTVKAQALELIRPLADTAVEVAMRTNNTTTTLDGIGLPKSVADTLGTGVGSLTSSWTLAQRAFDQLGGTLGRERLDAGLKATLDGLQTDSIQRLHSMYRTFIATEIEHIGLNLAARSEGAWSHVHDN